MIPVMLLSFALGADPAPPVVVEVPPLPTAWAQVEVPVNRRVRLIAPDQKAATWLLVDDTKADLSELNGSAYFWARDAGIYRVVYYQADKGFTKLAVTVKGAPPVVPPGPPAPDPGPTPPPNPADPLVAKVKAAFDANTEADKDETRKDLLAFFKVAQKLSGDPTVATVADLSERVASASDLMVGPGKLAAVRALFAAELQTAFPDGGDLDATKRAAVVKLFQRFSTSLNW